MRAFILLFLLVPVGFSDSAVNQSQEQKPQGTPLAFNQLGPKHPGQRSSYASVCGIGDRRRLVIRDHETWANVWKQINSGPRAFSWEGPGSKPIRTPLPPPPEIDFSRNMLLVVTMGSEPNGGYGIIVDGVYEQANQLEVVVHNVSPGRRCITPQVVTSLIDIVELEKREGLVTFHDLDIVRDCAKRDRSSDGPSNKSSDLSHGKPQLSRSKESHESALVFPNSVLWSDWCPGTNSHSRTFGRWCRLTASTVNHRYRALAFCHSVFTKGADGNVMSEPQRAVEQIVRARENSCREIWEDNLGPYLTCKGFFDHVE